jgi:hypothetical protein
MPLAVGCAAGHIKGRAQPVLLAAPCDPIFQEQENADCSLAIEPALSSA